MVAEELRVLAASDDIAEETGDRSTATWLATRPGTTTGPYAGTRRWLPLSGRQWTQTADALGAGDLNLAQARVIVEALDALPDDLGDDLVVKAEAYLVEQAGCSGRGSCGTSAAVSSSTCPRGRRRGRVPAALAEETRAQAATRLSFTASR